MSVQTLTSDNFDAVTGAASLSMVDFWASWCGPCKMVSPIIDGLAGQYAGKVMTGKVNVDDEPELAARFGVMSIPTIVFLRNGKEFDRKVGVMPEAAFKEVLDANL